MIVCLSFAQGQKKKKGKAIHEIENGIWVFILSGQPNPLPDPTQEWAEKGFKLISENHC